MTHRLHPFLPALVLTALVLAALTACGRDAIGDAEPVANLPPPPSPTASPLAMATPSPAATPTPTPTPTVTPQPTPILEETPDPNGSTECALDPVFGPLAWQTEDFFKWSPDGSRVLFNLRRGYVGVPLWVADMEGTYVREVVDTMPEDSYWDLIGPMVFFDASPDGSRLAYSTCQYPEDSGPKKSTYDRADYDYEIVISNIDGTGVTRLTENDYLDNFPVWSPDGTRLAYLTNMEEGSSGRQTRLNVLTLETGETRTYSPHNLELDPPVWSPDGRRIAVVTWVAQYGGEGYERRRPRSVYVVDTHDASEVRISETLSRPSWSPDGQRIALITPGEGEEAALYTFASDGGDPVRIAGLGLVEDIVPAHDFDAYSTYTYFGKSDADWLGSVYWSPDGSAILLDGHMVRFAADGSGITDYLQLDKVKRTEVPPETYRSAHAPFTRAAWSPDGSRIAVQISRNPLDYYPDNNVYLYTVNADGTEPRVLLTLAYSEDDSRRWRLVPNPMPPPPDLDSCSAGMAVPHPDDNLGLVEDCRTLLSIRDTLAGSDALDWSGDRPIAGWTGVELGGSPLRVHGLVYDGKGGGLYGWIPAEIANLSELRRLSLRNTAVNGPIPAELGNLANLEALILTWNQIKGSIPPELGNLSNLQELRLLFNKLTGCIPSPLRDRFANTDIDKLGLPYCE